MKRFQRDRNDLDERRAELDARCEQIDATFRELIAVQALSEDEVYRRLHPPLASELTRRKDVNAEILKRLDGLTVSVDQQERRRLLPSPQPSRHPHRTPTQRRHLASIGLTRHQLALLRADIWGADEGRLVEIERELSRIDLASLRRDVRRYQGRIIGGNMRLGSGHPKHYQLKRRAVILRQQHAGRYLSRAACARIIADRAKAARVTSEEILRGLTCECDDPPGYRRSRRG